ncbi:hypothetical protein SEVIR_2G074300v4 [Setaria viridis]|uniref:Uncharacterized protein n=1 Tax=Setaria viridis TaxID=4556 RepID=A0A4U6VML3_SETVI|nr:hypothetical protein SEVIR_2G074300v2 [Setaria viridis]
MSRPAGSARWTSVAAMAILLGSLVLVSFLMERSGKASLPLSFAAVGGRRMVIGTNGGLADQRRTLDDLRDGDDPLSNSKRRVPNGPDPIHNRGAGESGRSPGRA